MKHQKNAMKMTVMITEAIKIIQFLVQLARNGILNHHILIQELHKIIQDLVLVTITTAETLMDQILHGVIRLTQI